MVPCNEFGVTTTGEWAKGNKGRGRTRRGTVVWEWVHVQNHVVRELNVTPCVGKGLHTLLCVGKAVHWLTYNPKARPV